MAVPSTFGLREAETLEQVAEEAMLPGTLTGSEPNLLRAWVKHLGGPVCTTDVAGIAIEDYDKLITTFNPYEGEEPVPAGPADKTFFPSSIRAASEPSGHSASRSSTRRVIHHDRRAPRVNWAEAQRNAPHRWAPRARTSTEVQAQGIPRAWSADSSVENR